MKNKLQLYFDYFEEHQVPKDWRWYKSLKYRIEVLQNIKKELKAISDFEDLNDEEKIATVDKIIGGVNIPRPDNVPEKYITEIKNLQDFLDVYLFEMDNGVGDVSQGTVWDTHKNPHKAEIINNATPALIYEILKSEKDEAFGLIQDKLLNVDNNKVYRAVNYRFLRVIFAKEFVSPDAPGKFSTLIENINSKLDITIEGNLIEQHSQLCDLIETSDITSRQMFYWILPEILDNEINLKKALVYYGAPGTGKTFKSEITARQIIDTHRIKIGKEVGGKYAIQTVQFHPSYTYEDFFEGIRPAKGKNLKLFNGSFKQFCKINGAKEIALYKNEEFLKDERFKIVDYDFSRIKANLLNSDQKSILEIEGMNLAEGITIQEVIEPAFFIIDEINRAELSKVFGELMLSLEYRGYKGRIKTQYSHLCEAEDQDSAYLWENNENWFVVPQNLFLIGTMNTIDRSVDAFDFALRRRFMWEEVNPNYNVIRTELADWGKAEWGENLSQSLKKLNDQISSDEILNKHYQIGHSYVLELRKLSPDRFDSEKKAKVFLWRSFMQPLLEEYLRGLGDDQKAQKKIEHFQKSFI